MTSSLEDIQLQVYIGGGIGLFLIFILFLIVGYLLKKIQEFEKRQSDNEDRRSEDLKPVPIRPAFSLPKPNFARQWHEDTDNNRTELHFNDSILNPSDIGVNNSRPERRPPQQNLDFTPHSFGAKVRENIDYYEHNNAVAKIRETLNQERSTRENQDNFGFGRRPESLRSLENDFNNGGRSNNFDFGNIRNQPQGRNLAPFRNPMVTTPDYDEDKNFSFGPSQRDNQRNGYY